VSGGADRPLRATAVEAALIGGGAVRDAVAAFAAALDPPDNHAASAEYRRCMIVELLRRTIEAALAGVGNREGAG
jgi:carbon-monoxide dehydrogenase medium subunit